MKLKNVRGKRVLVTGAAMGLGKLYATRAVSEHASEVVLWDINEAALEQTAAELTALGGSVHTFVVDVSKESSIAQAAQAVRDAVGGIDILINNAGIVRGNSYFWETENKADIAATMNINSLAPMYIALEFLPAMVAGTTEARVLNIASSAGLVSNPRMSVYAASKWAALGWSDSVRLELEQAKANHVKITTLCPFYINTGMFDGAKGALLTPILKPDNVVRESWKALMAGDPLLIMPLMSRVNRAFQNIVPLKIRDMVLDFAGVYHSMEEFKGRK